MTLLTWTARPLTHAGRRPPSTACNDRCMFRQARTYPGEPSWHHLPKSADNSQYR